MTLTRACLNSKPRTGCKFSRRFAWQIRVCGIIQRREEKKKKHTTETLGNVKSISHCQASYLDVYTSQHHVDWLNAFLFNFSKFFCCKKKKVLECCLNFLWLTSFFFFALFQHLTTKVCGVEKKIYRIAEQKFSLISIELRVFSLFFFYLTPAHSTGNIARQQGK